MPHEKKKKKRRMVLHNSVVLNENWANQVWNVMEMLHKIVWNYANFDMKLSKSIRYIFNLISEANYGGT